MPLDGKLITKMSKRQSRLLMAGAGVGAALIISVIVIYSLSQASWGTGARTHDVDVTITGLKESYRAGEPVKFTVMANGISDIACNDNVPTVQVLQDSSGKEVWASKPSVSLADYCFEPQQVNSAWQFGNEVATHRAANGIIAIEEPGSYTVSASFEGQSVEQKIVVTE